MTFTLATLVTWSKLEHYIQSAFVDALRELAQGPALPPNENMISAILHRILMRQAGSARKILPFCILSECSSQPVASEPLNAARLSKRPDFTCCLVDSLASNPESAQLNFYVECKRLAPPSGAWVYIDNYVKLGLMRFVDARWSYALRSESAMMVGYVSDISREDALRGVNSVIDALSITDGEIVKIETLPLGDSPVAVLPRHFVRRTIPPNLLPIVHLWANVNVIRSTPASVRKAKSTAAARSAEVATAPVEGAAVDAGASSTPKMRTTSTRGTKTSAKKQKSKRSSLR